MGELLKYVEHVSRIAVIVCEVQVQGASPVSPLILDSINVTFYLR